MCQCCCGKKEGEKGKCCSGPCIRTVRIVLLVLIIIGLGLLATQKLWVPKLVNSILLQEAK